MEVNELVQAIDIVEYISQFIDLEQRGDEWWGLSCFKSENTPSFSVRQDPAFFYDYSSGIGGNLYTFITKYFKCSSKEAIQKMRDYLGDEGSKDSHQKMAATIVCKKYAKPQTKLKVSTAKILPNDYMQRFTRPDDKLSVWEREGIDRDVLDRFEVCYDKFANRLVYPIRSLNGQIVNIGGRTLDPDWKAKGLRKYCYYQSWGTIDTLYGLYEHLNDIKETGRIIIFEGCKSVLLAESWGITCGAAILTSHLNPNQMRILAGLGCRVIFALDKEVDVRLDKNVKKLSRYVTVEWIHNRNPAFGEKDSPVDQGLDEFQKLLANRIRFEPERR